MDKIFKIEDYRLSVNFRRHVVQLRAGYDLRRMLKKAPGALYRLAQMILEEYECLFKEKLNISERSLVAEIAGHVYAYRFFLRIRKVFTGACIRKLSYRVCKIDCGEKSHDGNRWFWDWVGYCKLLRGLTRNRGEMHRKVF